MFFFQTIRLTQFEYSDRKSVRLFELNSELLFDLFRFDLIRICGSDGSRGSGTLSPFRPRTTSVGTARRLRSSRGSKVCFCQLTFFILSLQCFFACIPSNRIRTHYFFVVSLLASKDIFGSIGLLKLSSSQFIV